MAGGNHAIARFSERLGMVLRRRLSGGAELVGLCAAFFRALSEQYGIDVGCSGWKRIDSCGGPGWARVIVCALGGACAGGVRDIQRRHRRSHRTNRSRRGDLDLRSAHRAVESGQLYEHQRLRPGHARRRAGDHRRVPGSAVVCLRLADQCGGAARNRGIDYQQRTGDLQQQSEPEFCSNHVSRGAGNFHQRQRQRHFQCGRKCKLVVESRIAWIGGEHLGDGSRSGRPCSYGWTDRDRGQLLRRVAAVASGGRRSTGQHPLRRIGSHASQRNCADQFPGAPRWRLAL